MNKQESIIFSNTYFLIRDIQLEKAFINIGQFFKTNSEVYKELAKLFAKKIISTGRSDLIDEAEYLLNREFKENEINKIGQVTFTRR